MKVEFRLAAESLESPALMQYGLSMPGAREITYNSRQNRLSFMGLQLSFFGDSDESDNREGTTKGLYFGAPEAEAEANTNSRIYLGDVFEDYLNVLSELKHEKFIITGRKGSGKTAIAEGIRYQAINSPNAFCNAIKNLDLNLEATVQDEKDEEVLIRRQLFEWIILTNMVSLIMKNEALKQYSDLDHLKKFINKNRGHVEVDEYETTSLVKEENIDVDITYFKRFFKARFGNKVGINAHQAPFYKIIKHLKKSVEDILTNDVDKVQGNEYVLIFDDLDLNFDSSRERDIDLLLSLLRTAKKYNNDVFGKTQINAKVFVLIRRDIKKLIMNHSADSAKLFNSYGVSLNWYEHIRYKKNEDDVKLKQFINDRIRKCFEDQNRKYNKDDPWASLVDSNRKYENDSGFKYILDHTFYRPRDLILFFDPIREYTWKIPMSKEKVDELIVKYSDKLMQEIRNELSLYFNASDIRSIYDTLGKLNKIYDIEYENIHEKLKKSGFLGDKDRAIQVLFDYSVIGNLDSEDRVKVKHRERQHERYTLNKSNRFILSYGIEAHFARSPQT